jgi:hypothetical protein
MQPQKSAADLYKEGRLNRQPFDPAASFVSGGVQPGTTSKQFTSRIWMPLVALGAIAATVEAAVVYAKSSETEGEIAAVPASTESGLLTVSTSAVMPHREAYTRSTAAMIQEAVSEQEARISATLRFGNR